MSAAYLGLNHPEQVVAVHRTDAGVPVVTGDPADLTPDERAWIEDAAAWGQAEGAYAAMHRTKPQTAAFGLTDSPAGLAAWIVEKLRAWSDCDGDVERSFTKDEILTNVTLYWLTETIGSSMRMYRANAAIPPAQLATPGRGAVRLLALPRRHRPPATGVARAHGERRARNRARARRAFRAVRGARALRAGAARVLPPLPAGSHELSAPVATISFAVRMASELRTGSATKPRPATGRAARRPRLAPRPRRAAVGRHRDRELADARTIKAIVSAGASGDPGR